MSEQDLAKHISCDPTVLAGKPVVKGTRLSVAFIVNLLAQGSTTDEILEEYEGMSPKDIQACLFFASKSLASATFLPLAVESS